MTHQYVKLTVNREVGHEIEPNELEFLTQQLRKELMDLDVAYVDHISSSNSVEKAKAGPVFQWGELLIALAASGGVLHVLIDFLREWSLRQNKTVIKLELDGDKIEVAGNPSNEQQRLIDTWLKRHSKKLSANE